MEDWDIGFCTDPRGLPTFHGCRYRNVLFGVESSLQLRPDGIRLIGPKPVWSRKDGGEAGLHPSNIHDNPYAVGTVDFTGDMPVILGPDGPSWAGLFVRDHRAGRTVEDGPA
jgi:urea carboxylase